MGVWLRAPDRRNASLGGDKWLRSDDRSWNDDNSGIETSVTGLGGGLMVVEKFKFPDSIVTRKNKGVIIERNLKDPLQNSRVDNPKKGHANIDTMGSEDESIGLEIAEDKKRRRVAQLMESQPKNMDMDGNLFIKLSDPENVNQNLYFFIDMPWFPYLPKPMIVLSWNCRGLGYPQSVPALRELVKAHKPDVVFLFETFVSRQ